MGLIPARINDYTSAMFPMKFFEYLAAGLPVVATPLPALEPYGSVVGLAADAEGFGRRRGRALRPDPPPRPSASGWRGKPLRGAQPPHAGRPGGASPAALLAFAAACFFTVLSVAGAYMPPWKLIYITSNSHSGSTLLDM